MPDLTKMSVEELAYEFHESVRAVSSIHSQRNLAKRGKHLSLQESRRDAILAELTRRIEVPKIRTSAETSAVAWPIDVMDGAEWNILDSTGKRIAVCGYDSGDKTHPNPYAQDCYRSGRDIAWAIVGMIRNLQVENETLRAALAAQAKGVAG